MMVGKKAVTHHDHPGLLQGEKEFFRPSDAGEREKLLAAQGGALRLQAGAQHRAGEPAQIRIAVAHHDHRIGARQIGEMAELQSALLGRVAGWLKPGGELVYAVCSLEAEEGEQQAADLPLDTLPIAPSTLPQGLEPTPEGWLRTDPGQLVNEGGLDGFFIARFGTKP